MTDAEQLREVIDELNAANAKIERYEAALEFYADGSGEDEQHEGWWVRYAEDCSDSIIRFLDDSGERAKKALEDAKEKE